MNAPILQKFIGFAALLRENAIEVSTDEVQDACRSVIALGGRVAQRELLLAAVEATLSKRPRDRDRFVELFHLHFESPDVFGDLETIAVDLEADPSQPERLAAALAQGRTRALADALAEAVAQVDLRGLRTSLQVGYFAGRVLARLDAPGIEAALERMLDPRDASQRSQALRVGARRIVERELEKRVKKSSRLEDRAFSQMSERERDEVRTMVARLAERLRDRERRRERSRRRGRLDVKGTLRGSLKSGGMPFEIVRRQRRRDRAELLVLTDVSDSVENTSELLLTFAHVLSVRFLKLRSFVFVDELHEATATFRELGTDAALAAVRRGEVAPTARNSNYGPVLRAFSQRVGPQLTRRSRVIILGDARSNYQDPELEHLDEVRRRARSLWWLCPEPVGLWGAGDSVMRQVARRVDRVFVTRNLRELTGFVDALVRDL